MKAKFKNNKSDAFRKKKKITFFMKNQTDHLIEDIITELVEEYIVKKVVITDLRQIDSEIDRTDICWFLCCDELVSYASKLKKAENRQIILKVNNYEAFSEYLVTVNWNAVDTVIFEAAYIQNFVLETNKLLKAEKTVLIYRGINGNKYKFADRGSGFNIAYVGPINYEQGPMLLLQMFKVIYDQDSRYQLFISGEFHEPRYILYFRQMLKELGLEGNVFCQGLQGHMDQWLEDKNYIISTSLLEGHYSDGIMEAMAKGIKPLIHNAVGVKEVFSDQYVWSTIDQCIDLIHNKEYKSQDYRKFIEENYSVDKQVSMVKEILEKKQTIWGNKIKKSPLVTIGLTNYNAEKYLDECLQSILSQSYKNIEVIVIDDKSTDSSLDKLRNYAATYSNIKIIEHNQNSGSPDLGRQEVIKYANGIYFMLFDSDDSFADQFAVEKMIKFAMVDENIDYIYCDLEIIDEKSEKINIWQYQQYDVTQVVCETFRRGGSGVLPMKGLFKTEFFRKNNVIYLSNGTAGDTLTALLCMKNGMKIRHLGEPLINYRQHLNNFTFDLEQRVSSIVNILEYIVGNFEEKIYFPEHDWDTLSHHNRQANKYYLVVESYYKLFNQFYSGQWKPWENDTPQQDAEGVKESLIPLRDLLLSYAQKVIDITNRYHKDMDILFMALDNIYSGNDYSLLLNSTHLANTHGEEKKIRQWLVEEKDVATANKLIRNSEQILNDHIIEAERVILANDWEKVAAIIQTAAYIAQRHHPGKFFSAELEKILKSCAEKLNTISSETVTNQPKSAGSKRHVLHVFSEGYETGGHTRLAARWMESDSQSIHSLIGLWTGSDMPKWIVEIAERSGGWYLDIGAKNSEVFGRAKVLREVAYSWADIIVLHTHPYDAIPSIAFGVDGGPPVLLLNHADHVFWLGVFVADMIADIRPAGQEVTKTRRGTTRSMLLPIPMVNSTPQYTREVAREKLGIPEDAILLLSIASEYKYTPCGNYNIIKVLHDMVQKHSHVFALVIGPKGENEWEKLDIATNGRARAVGIQHDLDIFHCAADIYLDSFSIASLTASLEAGLRGLPVLCLENQIARLLKIDDLSFTRNQDFFPIKDAPYEQKIEMLIFDASLRKQLGSNLAQNIKEDHIDFWNTRLQEIYHCLPRRHTVLRSYEKISTWSEGDMIWAYLQYKMGWSYLYNEGETL